MNNQVRQREKPEPHESEAGIPWYIWTLIVVAVLFGAGYLSTASLERDTSLPDMSGPVDGGQLYVANCVACHQASGSGLPGVFPPLAGAEWVTGDPAVLTQILLHGVSGELRVAGATYNGMMPAFGPQFDDAQIAAIASYIRSSFGNQAAPVPVALVAAGRAETAQRATPWQGQQELEKLGGDGG